MFHTGKQHGITDDIMNQINQLDLDILLVPDAGSNNYFEHKALYDRGILVAVIDHHECERLSDHALIINTQLSPEYPNKQLSGVGVVYKLLKKLDCEFGWNDADSFLDWVMLGNVADSQLITEPETRYYVYEGAKNLQSPLLKEFVFKHIGKWDKVCPQTLSFNLIPKINSMIRLGSQEDKQKLFYAMIGRDEEFYNTRTKRTENLIETVVRTCTNSHALQNRTKKKWLQIIKDAVQAENLNSRPILVIKFDKKDKFDNALGGVIASGLTNIYRKPVMILTYRSSNDTYAGSMRGYDDFTDDFKKVLLDTELFDYVQGHANAAGVQISAKNLELFNELQDKMIEQYSLEGSNIEDNPVMVDFIIPAKNMRPQIVDDVQKYEKYWSKGLEAPIFCIQDLVVNMSDIKVSTGGMLSLEIYGIFYTFFTASEEWIELAGTNNTVTFDAIGTLGINTFMGKEKRQMIVNNYIIKNVEESTRKKFLFEF